MKTLLAVAAIATLAGCQSAQQLRAQAPAQPDYEICNAMVAGNPTLRQVAWEEQQRRRLDCAPFMPMIQAQQQNDLQRAAIGAQLLQASRPQPYQAPLPAPSVNCVSRPSLGSVVTSCQ